MHSSEYSSPNDSRDLIHMKKLYEDTRDVRNYDLIKKDKSKGLSWKDQKIGRGKTTGKQGKRNEGLTKICGTWNCKAKGSKYNYD